MWLDKVLLSIGEDFKLKVSSDKVFGAIDGQYICLQHSQQGYTIVMRINEESRMIFESVDQTKGICKTLGIKSGRAEFINGHLVIKDIVGHIFASKSKDKIRGIILNLVSFLGKNQKYSNASSEKTILIEGIPGPNDEKELQKAELSLTEIAEKKINYSLGLNFGLFTGLGVGLVFGFISALMQKYGNADINPLGKGMIASGLASIVYKRLAGGIDKKSRLSIVLISVIIFLVWDLYLIYFLYRQKSGIDLDLERLIQIYKSHFINFSIMGKYALVALGASAVTTFFLVKRTDRRKVLVEDGQLLEGELLIKAKKLLKGKTQLGLIIGGGLLFFVASAFLSTTVYHRVEYISLDPFFIFGILVLVLTMLLGFVFINKTESIKLALLGFKPGRKETITYWFMLFFMSASVPLAASFIMSYINLAFDMSEEFTVSAKTNEEFIPGEHQCNSIELTSKEYNHFTQRICRPEANFIEIGEGVDVKVRRGYLNIPYALSFNIPSLSSFQEYISSGRKEEELRFDVIEYFFKNDKSESFKERVNQWESSCVENPGPKCRLRAYIYEYDKKSEQSLKLLQKACFVNDPVACRGILINAVAKEVDISEAKTKLKNECNIGNNEYCMELVYSLWNAGYKANRKEISRILNLSCSRGGAEACKTLKTLSDF